MLVSDGRHPSRGIVIKHNRMRMEMVKVAKITNTPLTALMTMPINLLNAIIDDINEIQKAAEG